MSSKIEKIKSDLKTLIAAGHRIYYGLAYEYTDDASKKKIKDVKLDFKTNYEKWYSESREVIKQLIPDRLKDFDMLYKNEKRKEVDFSNYGVSDALVGLTTRYGGEVKCNPGSATEKLFGQVMILESAEKSIDSLLFNLRTVLQADLFDGEIEEAKVLNKNGYLRAAGAVAGVVLEKHLQEVIAKKGLSISKKNPGISDLSEILKNANIIETKDWRFIQHLADIRNICDHKKSRDPKMEEIDDLISGVEKVIKTL